VTFGVPFPKGEAPGAHNVRLADELGDDVPLQVQKLAVWPDGSLKWGLLDFQADLKANTDRTLQLQFGDDVRRKSVETPLRVTKRGKGVEVVTGPLKFRVKPGRHLFLDRVWLDPKGIFGPTSGMVEGAGGRRSFYDIEHSETDRDVEDFVVGGEEDRSRVKIRSIRIEEKGPLRVVIAIFGSYMHKHLPDSPAIVRIHAYAGKSFLKVFHTFTYTGCPKQDYVKRMGLGLPIKLGRRRTVTVGGIEKGTPAAGDEVSLLQDHHQHYGVRTTDEELAPSTVQEGSRSAGWIDMSDGKRGLAVANRFMWQEFPQELVADAKGGSVTTSFWPDSVPPLDLRRYSDKMYRFLGETTAYREFGTHDVPIVGQATGLAKTHEALFYFHAGDAEAACVSAAARAFQMPSVVVAPPDYYRETKVIGCFAVPDPKRFPILEKSLNDLHEFYIRHQEESQWYGMIDFGDTQHTFRSRFRTGPDEPFKARHKWSYDEGRWGWTNTEGMPGLSFWLHFFRTGDRRFCDFAEAEARHVQDVDVFQWGPYKGRGHTRHNVNHWGDADIEDRISQPDSQRFCYFLTGNSRSRDSIEMVVDGHYLKDESGLAGGPTLGAHLYGMLVRWEMTGKQVYEQQFHKTLDLWLDAQGPDGGFPRRGVANTATGRRPPFDPSASTSVSMFIHNFGLMHAMAEFQELTGDERLKAALVRHAEYCIGQGPGEASHQVRCLAFAARESGDSRFKKKLLENLAHWGVFGDLIPDSPQTHLDTLHTGQCFFYSNAAPYAMDVLDGEPTSDELESIERHVTKGDRDAGQRQREVFRIA
jgi:hypothetical protein